MAAADMDAEVVAESRERRLKRLQMVCECLLRFCRLKKQEALGITRAEYTRTVDFKENYHHLDEARLEEIRLSNVAGTKEAKAVKGKEGAIAGWACM